MAVSDFPNLKEALKTADKLIEQNMADYDHEGETQEVDGFPLLNKYYYVQGHGKKREWQSIEQKELSGEKNLKSRKELSDTKGFREALGDMSPTKSGVAVKTENEAFLTFQKAVEVLRSVKDVFCN